MQQQHGALAADQPRQLLRAAAAGEDADLDLGQAEAGAFAGNDDVGAQRQFKSAAERVAFDGGDHRLRAVHDRAPVFLQVARHDLDRAGFRHLADVGAGREHRVRAGDDQAADRWVGGVARDLVGEPRAHLEIERIAHLRPVEPEHDNGVRRAFDEEGIRRGHGGLPMGWRCCAGHAFPSKGPCARAKVNAAAETSAIAVFFI